MRELSIFIDESGDFGKSDNHSPYYIVSMIFHNQSDAIINQIASLDSSLNEMGFVNHTIHSAPLIRREQYYKKTDISVRKKLFYKLFCFLRNIKIRYACFTIEKNKKMNQIDIINHLSKQISSFLKDNFEYFQIMIT